MISNLPIFRLRFTVLNWFRIQCWNWTVVVDTVWSVLMEVVNIFIVSIYLRAFVTSHSPGNVGSGKSTLLAVLGNREVPIPDHIDIFHLTREMPASDKTALKCVMEVDEERLRLEKMAEELVACEDDGDNLSYLIIFDRENWRAMCWYYFSLDCFRSPRTTDGYLRTIGWY